jgi:phosphatidylinositol-3-phosphatase
MREWAPALLGMATALVVLVPMLAPAVGVPVRPAPSVPSSSVIGPPTVFAGPIRHVVLVVLENAELSGVLTKGPYEELLWDKYSHATLQYAVCHPSAPNYLALTSGSTFTQCGSDVHHVFAASNLGDLLTKKKESWASFSESMPKACGTSDSYPYAVKHNPFVFYKDIVNNTTRCAAHDLTLGSWNADVKAKTIPNFCLIVPNLKNDGHDTGVAYADHWLKGWLAPYLTTSWFRSTVFLITYDEGSTNSGYHHLAGGHIFLVAVSPYSALGLTTLYKSSHYSLLTTIEWLLGLGSTGRNDKATLFPPLQEMFTFG